MNGKATEQACNEILGRLKKVAAEMLTVKDSSKIEIIEEMVYLNGSKTKLTWEELIKTANMKRVSLSSQSFYATPGIHFDKAKEKGKPFAYHSYGTAIIEATVDCLRGIYKIDSVKVVHDFGKSMNISIDKGQAEGAIMQGLGWMTIEEVIYNGDGKLLTDALSTYKVPDIHFTPDVQIEFLEDSENPLGVFKSKAIGEPPLMYGIGGYFAIMNAIKAFRPGVEFKFSAPITPEKVLLNIYSNVKKSVISV